MRDGLGASKTTAVCGVESPISAESGALHSLLPLGRPVFDFGWYAIYWVGTWLRVESDSCDLFGHFSILLLAFLPS